MAKSESVKKFEERIRAALDKADLAWWNEIAEAFPEATGGDFAPENTLAWNQAMERALGAWLGWNHPTQDPRIRALFVELQRTE